MSGPVYQQGHRQESTREGGCHRQAGQLELSWRRGFVGSVTDCSCCLGSIGKQKKVYQECHSHICCFQKCHFGSSGCRRWFCGKDLVLNLQRPQFGPQHPCQVGPNLPVTPAPGESSTLFWLVWELSLMSTDTHTHN